MNLERDHLSGTDPTPRDQALTSPPEVAVGTVETLERQRRNAANARPIAEADVEHELSQMRTGAGVGKHDQEMRVLITHQRATARVPPRSASQQSSVIRR